MDSIAAQLTKLRRDLGLTQAQIAQRVGVAQPVWARWETGTIDPGAEKVRQILLKLEHDLKVERLPE